MKPGRGRDASLNKYRIFETEQFEKDLRRVEEFRTITKDGGVRWIAGVGTRVEYQGRLADRERPCSTTCAQNCPCRLSYSSLTVQAVILPLLSRWMKITTDCGKNIPVPRTLCGNISMVFR